MGWGVSGYHGGMNPAPIARTPLVDGHTHVDQYAPAELAGLLDRAQAAGVGLIIAAGTSLASCARVLELADQHPQIRAGLGLHPADLEGPWNDATEAALRAMAAHPAVVEWSECGLDYMPASPERAVQQDTLRQQVRLAREFGLPLVVHSREADEDTWRILAEEHAQDVGGAWHYFGGTREQAERAFDLGFRVSLAKPLLREPTLQETAARLPLERVVIETDSYPQPFKKHRERWTEPWHLPQVAEALAAAQRVEPEAVAQATTANALAMLGGRVSLANLGR